MIKKFLCWAVGPLACLGGNVWAGDDVVSELAKYDLKSIAPATSGVGDAAPDKTSAKASVSGSADKSDAKSVDAIEACFRNFGFRGKGGYGGGGYGGGGYGGGGYGGGGNRR